MKKKSPVPIPAQRDHLGTFSLRSCSRETQVSSSKGSPLRDLTVLMALSAWWDRSQADSQLSRKMLFLLWTRQMKMMIKTPTMGRVARITKAIFHPTARAMTAPQTNMAKRLNMLPIFSPVAFWQARASLLKLDESSYWFWRSYHPTSCLNKLFMKAFLHRTAILSLRMVQDAKAIQEEKSAPKPTQKNMLRQQAALFNLSWALLVMRKESRIFPQRQANHGKLHPETMAKTTPSTINRQSDPYAKRYNSRRETAQSSFFSSCGGGAGSCSLRRSSDIIPDMKFNIQLKINSHNSYIRAPILLSLTTIQRGLYFPSKSWSVDLGSSGANGP